jgi:hypothetical protein
MREKNMIPRKVVKERGLVTAIGTSKSSYGSSK